MPIERQSEQWPHREAMLRHAVDWSQPKHLNTPLHTPESRPSHYVPDEWTDRHHFTPNDFNPSANSTARPRLTWEATEPEQPTLDGMPGVFTTRPDLGPLPSKLAPGNITPDEIYSADRAPQKLYRTINLDITHPNLGPVRRALFGDQREELADHPEGLFPHSDVPVQANPQGFDNKALGQAILDHFNSDPARQGMGTHWSLNPGEAQSFNTFGTKHRTVPVMISADWYGRGEDPYRTDTGGNYPKEEEITMMKGAPLQVTNMHIQHPDTGQWHSIFDGDPQHRNAALKHAWPGPQGYPYRPETNDYDTGYLNKIPLDPRTRKNYPGGPRNLFSPTAFNPPSDSPSRPRLKWEEAEPEQDPLPLEGVRGTEYGWPGGEPHHKLPIDRKPQKLWRGVLVDLNHPELGEARRRLFGPDWEDGQYTNAYPDPPEALPGMPSLSDLAKRQFAVIGRDPELARIFLDHIGSGFNSKYTHSNSLGKHWTTDFENAKLFSSYGMNDHAEDFGLPLSLVLGGQWHGAGEDPYRHQTGGEFPHEKEITLLPHAPLRLTDMHLEHPDTQQWHRLYVDPSHRHARRLP